jgi:FkbM family methyltransferase
MSAGSVRQALHRARRNWCEAVGIARYSRPALHELDRKLERHLDFDGGTFIEAGANDGYEQSNTYYFEKMRRWTGLLVEPIPELAARCRRNRRVPVIEAALVADASPGAVVELHFAGLMSTARGALGDATATDRHVHTGIAIQQLAGSYVVSAAARTLSSIIDESGLTREIDLLSLDIEGGEPQALRGLDFNRHAPRYICVEVRDRRRIDDVLLPRYDVAEVLSQTPAYEDILYRLR